MSLMTSNFSVAGPRPKLKPMQPRPSAETSRPLFPNVRFCMISPGSIVRWSNSYKSKEISSMRLDSIRFQVL